MSDTTQPRADSPMLLEELQKLWHELDAISKRAATAIANDTEVLLGRSNFRHDMLPRQAACMVIHSANNCREIITEALQSRGWAPSAE